jgi:hypothetical protein
LLKGNYIPSRPQRELRELIRYRCQPHERTSPRDSAHQDSSGRRQTSNCLPSLRISWANPVGS